MEVSLLQWNPHWECFDRKLDEGGACERSAEEALAELLQAHDVDFANVVMLEDKAYAPPGPWKLHAADCKKDRTSVIHNSRRWRVLPVERLRSDDAPAAPLGGCMFDSRAFQVMAFERLADPGRGLRVVVAGAHYPHEEYAEGSRVLAEAINATRRAVGSDNVILLADTNQHDEWNTCGLNNSIANNTIANDTVAPSRFNCTSEQIMEDLDVPDAGATTATAPLLTCCADNDFIYSFDRAVANFGEMSTVACLNSSLLPNVYQAGVPPWGEVLKPAKGEQVRSWLRIKDRAAFHRPILGLLSVAVGPDANPTRSTTHEASGTTSETPATGGAGTTTSGKGKTTSHTGGPCSTTPMPPTTAKPSTTPAGASTTETERSTSRAHDKPTTSEAGTSSSQSLPHSSDAWRPQSAADLAALLSIAALWSSTRP